MLSSSSDPTAVNLLKFKSTDVKRCCKQETKLLCATTLTTSDSYSGARSLSDLHDWQADAIDFLYEHDHNLLFAKPGAGKTVMGATAITELLRDGVLSRVLVPAPKRVAQITWPNEFAEWTHLIPWLDKIAVAIGEEEARDAARNSTAQIVMVNYENLGWFFEDRHNDWGFDGILFDELTKVKKLSGVRLRGYKRQMPKMKWRTGATGTPTSNGLQDMHGQVWVIDRGRRLGRTITSFKNEYFYRPIDAVNPWDIRPKAGAFDRAMDEIADISYLIENYAGLPPYHETSIRCELPSKVRDMYNELENEYFLELDDFAIEAANAGVKVAKLEQIAQGFLYRPGERTFKELHTEKLEAFGDLVDELRGEPLLVAYKFQADLERLQKRWPAPYLGSGVSDTAAADAVRDWNAGKLPILYVHPASAGHGLNMQKGGNRVAWFAYTWSFEEHNQLVARLRRQGQESDMVFGHRFEIVNSVDDDKRRSVNRKTNWAIAFDAGIRERQHQRSLMT